ncbi:MAG TPA: class I SAM-dependent methyltransferase [Rubrobacter sp.]|nr:class I SAM-dependent methyltransferase [Rubrobacter sp.]
MVQYQGAPSRAPLTESGAIPLAKGPPLSAREDPGRLRTTFDDVAPLYDEVRPGYPERLFDDLAALSDTGEGARALEIGCGTGQATLPLARRGYRILGVELGVNLAAVTRAKLAEYPDARVLTCSFEEWPLEEGTFDLVVSATAFHWVDPRVRYRKSARALRPDGSLALIWNRADPEGSSEGFFEALEEIHRREAPELAPERRPPRLDWDPDKAGEIERSGFFERPEERVYRFGVAHGAESYLRLLSTYSAHRSLDEVTRRRLFMAVGQLIDEEYGGHVIEGYRSELYVSRKR